LELSLSNATGTDPVAMLILFYLTLHPSFSMIYQQ
jgi:hypothetical protein